MAVENSIGNSLLVSKHRLNLFKAIFYKAKDNLL